MEYHLETIAKSYDRTIEFGRKGIDLYKDLPCYIKDNPDYPKWKAEMEVGSEGSACIEIKD